MVIIRGDWSKNMKKIFAIFFVFILGLSACNLPVSPEESPTPTVDLIATQVSILMTQQPTPTLPPTDTAPPAQTPTSMPSPTLPAPSPTPVPGDPALALGAPFWQDNLDTAKNFYLYENDNTKIEEEEGSIALVGRNANGWHGWTLTYAAPAVNLYVEEVFRTRDCARNDLYGIVFRASKENSAYFFGVTCDGRYNLYARDFNNNVNAELVSLTADPAILSGSNQTNRLGVMAKGNTLRLYANGVLLKEIDDATYGAPYFGAFVAANQTANFRVDLDQISMWKLE